MNKQSVIAIAEGLKQIEDGVEKIQRVMREENIKSIKEVAAELEYQMKILGAEKEAFTSIVASGCFSIS